MPFWRKTPHLANKSQKQALIYAYFSNFCHLCAHISKYSFMVHELRIKNFRSFKEETVISFEASKDTFKQDSLLVTMNDGTRLSRIAIIYGANASGKSNLLEVFEYLF